VIIYVFSEFCCVGVVLKGAFVFVVPGSEVSVGLT
jgi:hypothetical protein